MKNSLSNNELNRTRVSSYRVSQVNISGNCKLLYHWTSLTHNLLHTGRLALQAAIAEQPSSSFSSQITFFTKHRVATVQSSNSLIFPRLFRVFPTEALIFIKPPEIYIQAYMYSWVNTVSVFVVHLVHVNFYLTLVMFIL